MLDWLMKIFGLFEVFCLHGFSIVFHYFSTFITQIVEPCFFHFVWRPEARITASTTSPSGYHPLLAPCLNGLGKFSHLIDLDFMGDLMNYLKRLASSGDSSEKQSQCLTVSERLHCCIVAFKVMRRNLDALNVDLQDFFVQLYNVVLEYRPGRLVLKSNTES